MRTAFALFVFAAAAAACLPSFPDEECYADVDCPAELVCSADNRCIMLSQHDGGPRDAGFRDAGRRDAGEDRDAGPERDGGSRDAGPPRDGGPFDAGFDLRVAPTALTYGSRIVGCPGDTRRVTLENRGAISARIDAIQLTNGTSSEYTFAAPAAPFNLPAQQARTIDVTYTPTNVGMDEGALQIAYASSMARLEVQLSGAGQNDAEIMETFTATVGPIDILFVVDSASFMEQPQTFLAGRMVFTLLDLGIDGWDYRIAVTTMDTSPSGARGAFVGTPRIITPTTPNLQARLEANVQVGTTGPTQRRGFDAVQLALTSPLIDGANAGFLRAEAPLLIIYVSADDDLSTVNVTQHLAFLQGLKAGTNQPAVANAITPTSFACTVGTGTGFEGADFIDLAMATSGVVSNMCGSDWDAAVTTFPPPTVRRTYRLQNAPMGNMVTVFVDGAMVPSNGGANWSYDSVNNEVVFTPAGAPAVGATVEIRYRPVC